MDKQSIIASIFGLLLSVAVGFLLWNRRISFRNSMLWVSAGFTVVILALKRDWLEYVANIIGVYYPPAALFLIFIGFMIGILIHFSVILTELKRQNIILAQRIAVLETKSDVLASTTTNHVKQFT